jgi:hypothetical protein
LLVSFFFLLIIDFFTYYFFFMIFNFSLGGKRETKATTSKLTLQNIETKIASVMKFRLGKIINSENSPYPRAQAVESTSPSTFQSFTSNPGDPNPNPDSYAAQAAAAAAAVKNNIPDTIHEKTELDSPDPPKNLTRKESKTRPVLGSVLEPAGSLPGSLPGSKEESRRNSEIQKTIPPTPRSEPLSRKSSENSINTMNTTNTKNTVTSNMNSARTK